GLIHRLVGSSVQRMNESMKRRANPSITPQSAVSLRTKKMLNRPTLFTILILLAALAASAPPALAAGDDVPAWLRQAAGASVPAYERDVPAVVINNEESITVSADGSVTTVTTYAVRVLTRAGAAWAGAAEHYETDSGGKVLEMRAWLIRPDGGVKKYGKDETLDRIADSGNLYDESRLKEINATRDAEV